MPTRQTHPIVLRMAGMFPKDLGGYEGHRHRKGGDLGHVDRERSKLNRPLHGREDWAATALAEIDDMRTGNFASELEKLRKRRRTAEIKKRIVEGPRDPWRSTRHGPLREVILTANKAWFEEIDSESFDDLFGGTREERFEALAVSWLTEHFGDDLIHARADLDEEAYHIHAVILPRGETKDGRRMLQPSKHAMIRDYEAAQDSVGALFSEIGLHRGERRAEAIRAAIKHNRQIEDRNVDPESKGAAEDDATTVKVEVPERREHVSPRDWRRAQEERLAEQEQELTLREDEVSQRETDVRSREADADAVLDIARKVASGATTLPAAEDPAADGPRRRLAKSLFSKALEALRIRAKREAREELTQAFKEIRKADEAIIEVAQSLPEKARGAIAEARKSLARALVRLPKQLGQDRSDPTDLRSDE